MLQKLASNSKIKWKKTFRRIEWTVCELSTLIYPFYLCGSYLYIKLVCASVQLQFMRVFSIAVSDGCSENHKIRDSRKKWRHGKQYILYSSVRRFLYELPECERACIWDTILEVDYGSELAGVSQFSTKARKMALSETDWFRKFNRIQEARKCGIR